MRRLLEKTLSFALSHPANRETLRNIVSEAIGEDIKNFKFISREFPIPIQSKTEKSPIFALFKSGTAVNHADMLTYGKIEKQDAFFVIEFKYNITMQAFEQLAGYTLSIPTQLIDFNKCKDHIGRDAKIYRAYADAFMQHYNLKATAEKGNFTIVPILISITRPPKTFKKPIKKSEKYIPIEFETTKYKNYYGAYATKKLIEFLSDNNVSIGPNNNYKIGILSLEDYRDGYQLVKEIFRSYVNSRIQELCEKFPNKEEKIKTAIKQKYRQYFIPKFITSTLIKRETRTYIEFMPIYGEVSNSTREKISDEIEKSYPVRYGSLNFYQLQKALINAEDPEFVVQLFPSGINKPVYYFKIDEDKYAALQHFKEYCLRFDGIFNNIIAKDAFPFTKKPIIFLTFSPWNGKYQASHIGKTRIVKVKLSKNENEIATMYLFSPHFKPNEIMLPYMIPNEKAKNIISQLENRHKDTYEIASSITYIVT
ncbi:hypothetical protein DRO69_07885 [Candidatus Bathyarchaeota archaeon]|nr:MAG: hypothetical protein DRO69_07885 [Candidatus Bathyarchaeota archaeon]